MWGEVADISIKGIQGDILRGFLFSLVVQRIFKKTVWNQNRTESIEYDKNKVEYNYTYIASLFILVSIITTISQYY